MVRNLEELGPNLQKIITRLLANQNLVKLLYYNDKNPLEQPDLTTTEINTLIADKYIKWVPRVGPKDTANSMVVLRVISGLTGDNDQFRNITIGIEVFVPLTQWAIKSANLRPFCIMGEIQKSLSNKTIDGFGRMIGGDFELSYLTEEIACYSMDYSVVNYA